MRLPLGFFRDMRSLNLTLGLAVAFSLGDFR